MIECQNDRINDSHKLDRKQLPKMTIIISVPLKSGQININQTIPEKGKN